MEFCFFDVVDNNTNPSYVFTAGYLNHTITKSFELQFNGHNIGFIGVINTDKRIILDWCVPIIIEKLRSSLCSAEAEMNARSLLDEPRGYRKLCKDKAGSITAVVDLTENIVKDRINDPEVLEQFHNEIVCSSIESSCCDLPIVYDKELKAWQSGWDEQCLKVKKGNQESTIKWIESSDFTIKPDIEQFNETSETIDDTFSSAITNKRKSLYSTYVPSLKPFAEDDPDKFKFKLPSLITPKKSIIMIPENSINMIPENSTNMIPENSINMIPENSINMIPENSKLFSHKDIANLNSKKKETECREVGKLAIKTVNEQSINDYKIPSLYSTLVPSAPQQRSPIRPRSSQSILSIDRSAKKYRDLLNSSSSSEHKRKVDNDVDDVVFVGETKKKPSSNDENNNGPKKHKLYIPTEDDELILIEDADRPSTSSSSKNRFKLFKTKNTRLQGIPNRCDLTNSSFSTSRSRYNRHNKR